MIKILTSFNIEIFENFLIVVMYAFYIYCYFLKNLNIDIKL